MFFIYLQILFENAMCLKYGVFKLFTKTTCENLLYYAEFGSSRLQKRLEYSGNGKKRCFLACF